MLVALFKKDPRVQFIVGLAVFFIFSSINYPIFDQLKHLILCLVATIVFDCLFSYIKLKKVEPPISALITALILTLVIDPVANWYTILFICFAAVASKHFLLNTKHIFNPAAFGLLLGWLVFKEYPAWWAASLSSSFITNLFLIASLGYCAWIAITKYKRQPEIISYLVSFAFLFELFIATKPSFESMITTVTNLGMLFFATIMLPEPKTTPVRKKEQILYGAFVGALNVLFSYLTIHSGLRIPDASIVGLLFGNLLVFGLNVFKVIL